ncbi:MAG: hypothetical protein EB039_06705, partial [Proteobacteria bacterium]|nr:hypothetical protein [Pseudomonadota bacterium]
MPWIIRVRATGDLELPWADESGSAMAWSVRKVLLASPKGFQNDGGLSQRSISDGVTGVTAISLCVPGIMTA